MGIASSQPATPETEAYDAASVAKRQRSFELLESFDPGRSFRWVTHVWFLYRSVGGGRAGVERARPVFRAALARFTDSHDHVYGAWTMMEEQEGFVDEAGALYEEWRAAAGRHAKDESFFWRSYMSFELEHGGAERARAVAQAGVAACPSDGVVRARCVLTELMLGDDARARDAFERGVADFAAAGDTDAERQMVEEVRRKRCHISDLRFGGWLSFWHRFRHPRWWEQL